MQTFYFMTKSIFLFIIAVSFFSCSKFNKILKSEDVDYKLEMANKYYESKKYNKAQQLYSELFSSLRGSDKFEDVYYKYAYCAYYLKDYMNAENLFKGYLGVFPNQSRSEEVAYMQAYSFFKMSPKVELDQTNTLKSIGMMQSFINSYPNSSRIKDAQDIINECRNKLEEKDFKSAKLYFDLSQFQAAGIYFFDLSNQYPDSERSDEYLFMALKSNFEFAGQSIPNKQEERYEKVVNDYFDFVDRFPDSKYLSDADKLKTESEKNIKQLKNEQVNKTASR